MTQSVEILGGRASIYVGDVRDGLAALPDRQFHCCVTSPPYWGLRDYGAEGQIGLEVTPQEYIAVMVEVFRGVRRVLRDDGVLWVNMGDSYAGGFRGGYSGGKSTLEGYTGSQDNSRAPIPRTDVVIEGLKAKDLVGMPWRLAFALQADGWYLRSDCVWAKPNAMPESVTDRPTKSHEYVFLLTKSARYFFDSEAVKERLITGDNGSRFDSERKLTVHPNIGRKRMPPIGGVKHADGNDNPRYSGNTPEYGTGRNLRTVWTIPTQAYSEAHFATFPEKLAERCIKSGTSEKGCCGRCGAPWGRVLRPTGRMIRQQHGRAGTTTAHIEANGRHGATSSLNTGVSPEKVTSGWRPGCECGAGDPHPCRVLDPFLGSGTTLAVALQLGRLGVGCELNPEYAAMAADRIGRAARPHTHVSARGSEEAPLFVNSASLAGDEA